MYVIKYQEKKTKKETVNQGIGRVKWGKQNNNKPTGKWNNS